MSYELTQEKLTKANKLLLKDLHNTLGIDKSVLSNNQLLQKLSQALFSKPYEETKETILSPKVIDTIAKVFLLHYDSEIVLTLNGDFYTATNKNLDNEISTEEIKRMAIELAKVHNSHVKTIHLPQIIFNDDGFEYEDIVLLARKMGYFKYLKTIFDLIEDDNSKIFIDGEHAHFKLDGEWESEMISEWDEERDIEEHIIWHPEIGEPKSYGFKEFYFSFKELCSANRNEDGSWIVSQNNGSLPMEKYKIEFKF